MLLNLLGNAVKFTQKGEVVLNVRHPREREIHASRIFRERHGHRHCTGWQGRLFQAFVQADASTTRRFGGTGSGLAICRRLVELMHGDIGFESTPAKGQVFGSRFRSRSNRNRTRAGNRQHPRRVQGAGGGR